MSEESQEDWFLREWLAHFGKIQSSLVNELGWDKAKANYVYHSKQGYKRELVNEVATWLGIKTYELLMRPAEALALREFRKSAAIVAAADQARVIMPAEKASEPVVANAPTPPRKRSA